MRNRSEQLTSAFIDTDEESDDGSESEDDWKPSNSSKRTTLKSKSRVPKRKSAKKRKYSESDDEESNDDTYSDDDDDDDDYFQTPSPSVSVPKKKPEETNFKLLLYVNDLDQNYKNNVHLCLWRRDKNSLLQKYIRVKTDNNEDFIFTSSSVYSSWDEKCANDFVEILVKQMEENKRRVQIVDMIKLNSLVYKQISVYKNNDNYSDEEND